MPSDKLHALRPFSQGIKNVRRNGSVSISLQKADHFFLLEPSDNSPLDTFPGKPVALHSIGVDSVGKEAHGPNRLLVRIRVNKDLKIGVDQDQAGALA